MASSAPQIQQQTPPPHPQTVMIYPTPPPISPHVYENNDVTSKKPKMTCQNKELTVMVNPRKLTNSSDSKHNCTTYGDIHKYILDLHLLPQIDPA
jgi:hypothetical protein